MYQYYVLLICCNLLKSSCILIIFFLKQFISVLYMYIKLHFKRKYWTFTQDRDKRACFLSSVLTLRRVQVFFHLILLKTCYWLFQTQKKRICITHFVFIQTYIPAQLEIFNVQTNFFQTRVTWCFGVFINPDVNFLFNVYRERGLSCVLDKFVLPIIFDIFYGFVPNVLWRTDAQEYFT